MMEHILGHIWGRVLIEVIKTLITKMFENFSNKLIFQALIILDEEEQKCILEITKTIFLFHLNLFHSEYYQKRKLIHIWNWKILQIQNHQFKTMHFAVKFKNVEIFKHNMLRLSTPKNCRFNKKKYVCFAQSSRCASIMHHTLTWYSLALAGRLVRRENPAHMYQIKVWSTKRISS